MYCKSGYESEKKKPGYIHVPVYKFPINDVERKDWVDNLPRSSNVVKVTQHMGVCRKHFREDVKMMRLGDKERPMEPPEKHLNNVPARNYGESMIFLLQPILVLILSAQKAKQ